MLSFDPSFERLERAAKKEVIGITLVTLPHYDWLSDSYTHAKFYFVESTRAQEISDSLKEDGIIARFKRCL